MLRIRVFSAHLACYTFLQLLRASIIKAGIVAFGTADQESTRSVGGLPVRRVKRVGKRETRTRIFRHRLRGQYHLNPRQSVSPNCFKSQFKWLHKTYISCCKSAVSLMCLLLQLVYKCSSFNQNEFHYVWQNQSEIWYRLRR